jgi:hypothetical protein
MRHLTEADTVNDIRSEITPAGPGIRALGTRGGSGGNVFVGG